MSKAPRVVIVDYGMGNLRSVAKALERAGASPVVSDRPSALAGARAVVLPGVGAFSPAVAHLARTGFDRALPEFIDRGRPFLGLCLGFQLLFPRSDEGGRSKGMGLIAGDVPRFPARTAGLKIPHMGWNTVDIRGRARESMFRGIPQGAWFYFVHSYYGRPDSRSVIASMTEYGLRFCSAIVKDRVWACQFHPEKSGPAGLKLLGNFVREVTECS